MLDYIGVDYPHTVRDGRVLDPVEYAEMREFSIELVKLMNGMPESEEKQALTSSVKAIQYAIQQKLDGRAVGRSENPHAEAKTDPGLCDCDSAGSCS